MQMIDALPDFGVIRKRGAWARFSGCSVTSLDLVEVSDWGLADGESDALFDEALPVEGFQKLVRPSAVHALLILARRVGRDGQDLDDKRRASLRQLIADDPSLWDEAESRAPAWRASKALANLKTTYKTSIPSPKHRKVRAAAELFRSDESSRLKPYVKSLRSVAPSLRTGRLVAFSGLDGSGKSSQAEALQESCSRLGLEAVVVWTRLSYNPSLNFLALPVKRFLIGVKGLMHTSKRSDVMPTSGIDTAGPSRKYQLEGKQLRASSASMTQAWATIVALANSVTQRRIVRHHLRRGRIVICDRYVLDSVVHLRYRYGEERTFRWQARLIKAASPRPVASYFLDVPAEVALSRKAEQYNLGQLTQQARLYREEHSHLGVKRVDGERAVQELCAEITPEVWQRL